MLRVIVHVKHQRSKDGIDVEVPAEIPVGRLAELLSRALNWNDCGQNERVTYKVRETAGGAPLAPESSLADLKLWDGTHLFFEPVVHRDPAGRVQVQPATLISDSGRRYPLVNPLHRLGRSSFSGGAEANLVDLKSEPLSRTVSREHAQLRFEQTGWVLHALPDVQNQTLHNEKALEPSQSCQLEDGDLVQLGGVRLRFRTTPPLNEF